jgi:hypothetical protein
LGTYVSLVDLLHFWRVVVKILLLIAIVLAIHWRERLVGNDTLLSQRFPQAIPGAKLDLAALPARDQRLRECLNLHLGEVFLLLD